MTSSNMLFIFTIFANILRDFAMVAGFLCSFDKIANMGLFGQKLI